MDDHTIMPMLIQDEALWYCTLIEHYSAYVTAIISGMGKGFLASGDIEEVASDVFFKIWLKREQLKAETLKAYIAQIARNAAIDKLRKNGRTCVSFEEDIFYTSHPDGMDEIILAKEQKAIIVQAVNSFGEPDRKIFIRFYYFGETIKKIANRLGMNESTAKTKLHRLRGKLKAIMLERGYRYES